MKIDLTLVFRKVPEGYIGFVEELPGANSQGETLGEVRANLEEAVMFVLEANRKYMSLQIMGWTPCFWQRSRTRRRSGPG